MIYIQSKEDSGILIPHHFDAACAMYAAIENGIKYRLTSFEEVQMGKFDGLIRSNMFVGSVEFMREVFGKIGKSPKVPHNSNRPHQIMSVYEVKNLVKAGLTPFIKPIEIKLFTGFVVDSLTIQSLNSFPDELNVMVYSVFSDPILSEWRCYVHNGHIVDARNYSGDFTITPNFTWVDKTIVKSFCKENKFPCAYTVDVAVLDDMKQDSDYTEVIEFNDGWALGAYGIDNTLYYRMLKDRYFEIIKS